MDNNKLKLAEERFYTRFEALNSEILQEFGKTISKFEGLTPTEAHILAQQMKNGREIDKIMENLEKASQLSRKDLEELLEIAAEENIEFANVYYEAKGMDKVSYKDSKQFQDIVKSVGKTTQGVFANLSNTTAIKLLKDNGEGYLKGIREAYEDVIDRCVLAVSTGQNNYQKAMYDTIKQLSNSGIKKLYYENERKKPYARRLDSSVRQNILEGVRQVNIGVQEQVGKEFGADGVEISAHSPCASDHIFIQGNQYTKKQFNKINANLKRPIGTLNCTHFVFSIVLGVSSPSYTQKQLNQFKKESNEIIEYEGKKYTRYEATQVQRRLETKIRQQKDLQITSKASGNKEGVRTAQQNITSLTKKYKDFSEKAGLDTQMQRMRVVSFKRINVNNMK